LPRKWKKRKGSRVSSNLLSFFPSDISLHSPSDCYIVPISLHVVLYRSRYLYSSRSMCSLWERNFERLFSLFQSRWS
jgi:hypothetical protein